MGVMTGLLLLLWAGVAVSTPVDLQKRIIGGENCTLNERLYHVLLEGSNGTSFTFCGGSLISDRWILTAEHCWITEPGWTLTAYLGFHPGGQATPQAVTPHFYRDKKNRTHDIMLLRLNNRTPIQPVPLPVCGNPLKPGDTVEVAGYGSKTMGPNNERRNDTAAVLQCANITVRRCWWIKLCDKVNKDKYSYQDWRCYKSPGVDTSPGDSGGGVVFNGMIYGVHVFSLGGGYACVAPGGFMDVCEYMDWIVDTTGIPAPEPRQRPKSLFCCCC